MSNFEEFSNPISVNGIIANGSPGTPGQILISNGVNPYWGPTGTWKILAASAVPSSVITGTTETALVNIIVPANSMGPNGILRVTMLWTHTNSANTKLLRLRLGGSGVSGSLLMNLTGTTSPTSHSIRTIQNRGSNSSQITTVQGNATGFGALGTAPVTAAVDMTADQLLAFTGQTLTSGETISLESYVVEVFYQS